MRRLRKRNRFAEVESKSLATIDKRGDKRLRAGYLTLLSPIRHQPTVAIVNAYEALEVVQCTRARANAGALGRNFGAQD